DLDGKGQPAVCFSASDWKVTAVGESIMGLASPLAAGPLPALSPLMIAGKGTFRYVVLSYVVILDDQGHERKRIPVKPTPPDKNAVRLWKGDLDGDGKEELLFVSDGKVCAVRGDGTPLWKKNWPLPDGPWEIVEIRPGVKKNQPATV